MSDKKNSILWIRIILTGLAIVIIGFLVLMIVTTVYAFILAIKARGAPDTEMISQFGEWLGMWLGPLLIIVLTYFGAIMVARKAGRLYLLHGILVGVIVALASLLETKLFGGNLDLKEGTYLLFYLVAAGLGGYKAIAKDKR